MDEQNMSTEITEREPTIQEVCDNGRLEIASIARRVKFGMINSFFNQEQENPEQHSEMKANLMLAYRHLEDARMRLGKVLQAKDGGVSVYDK